MRRIFIPSAFLFLAACATQPTPVQPAQAPQQPAAAVSTKGHIVGLTAEELVQRFGTPALKIREGDSWKVQFRSNRCVLDAYLYPPAQGRTEYRVTYIETRTRSMAPIDQAICIASFETP